MASPAESFGRSLRSARRQIGLTQGELGQKAGISSSQVYRLEVAEREPRLSTILSLASALGMEGHELIRDVRD